MDPASAAGIGLGVTSLVFQLFSGCVKSYQLMLDVVNMPKQVEPLRIRMRLEQIRLLEWGQQVGLLEDVLEVPSLTLQLHRNLIIDVLLQIQGLFQACLKIEAKFTTATSLATVPLQAEDSNLSRIQRTNLLLGQALKVVGRSSELPKRLEWAMVKQDRFERLIEHLIGYNDSIVSLLDRSTICQVHEMQVQSSLMMLQLSSQIEDLRQLTQAMQVRPDGAKASSPVELKPEGSSQQNILSEKERSEDCIVSLANFKANRIIVEMNTSDHSPALINRSDVGFEENDSSRQLGIFNGSRIWIEWKEYDQFNQLPSWREMIETRVRNLTALLAMKDKPAEFRSPTCLGCFHDDEEDDARFGLVYALPSVDVSDLGPISLLNLIKSEEPPSLTKRIQLASELASSIMYLHSVNWLHKGIRSDNTIFFRGPNTVPDYTSPIISGFEYARPDLPDEMTEKPALNLERDIYRHPNAMSRPDARSQKSWDIYSLGIVLIEIVFWQSIDVITGIDFKNKRAAISMLRKMKDSLLSEDFQAKIGRRFGDTYQEVVRKCINGGRDLGIEETNADESDPEVGAELLRVFFQDVVGKLKSVHV